MNEITNRLQPYNPKMDSNETLFDMSSQFLEMNSNETVSNITSLLHKCSNKTGNGNSDHSGMKASLTIVFGVVYVIGIIGNAVAIIALRIGERRVKNRKHLLLLTSLAANDLVALVGMMCAMLVGILKPDVGNTQPFCALRVVLRVFGIGSVCIAVTMALERYLALTRPFLYQKQVTYYVIRTALLVSWFWAAVLTCAPVLGLGRYHDPVCQRCVRYRNAITTTDFIYAAFYVAFGTLLCMVLVYCNLAVIRALYAISAPRAGGAPVVRRVSKSSCRQRQTSHHSGTNLAGMHHNAATAEEVAFSRLMATLSVMFMICWLPQMITSTLFLALGPHYWEKLEKFGNLADALMLLNYVLDPILYVLMRHRSRPRALCHSLVSCFKRGHKTSTESITFKSTCCQQETVVVSDSSGAEMRPLQPQPSHIPTGSLLKVDD